MADVVLPDEVYTRNGEEVARWGAPPVQPYEADVDPVPSVYATSRMGGLVEIHEDVILDLDVAEALAVRILAAVQHGRAHFTAQSTEAGGSDG